MKITKPVKGLFLKELKKAFEKEVTLAEFNEVFLFLDRWNTALRTVPYGIYDNDEYLLLSDTDSGVLFSRWLDVKTSNIDSSFNKGRKIVRLFKNLVQSNNTNLAYSLPSIGNFTTAVASLFVDYDTSKLPFLMKVRDEERFIEVLETLRCYIAAIMYIDILSDSDEFEKLLALFLNRPNGKLISYTVKLGIIGYHENGMS